jgi:predicted porin
MGVKAGEDLAEGMKISGVAEFGYNLNAANTTPYTRQSFMTLGGAFGQIRVGRQYAAAFNNSAAVDPGGAILIGTLYQTVVTDGTGAGESPLRQSNNIQYDLPSFFPGVTIGLNAVRAGANTASGVATGDGSGYSITYANGPIYAGYTKDTAVNLGAGQLAAGSSAIAASAVDERKLTTTSASYDFGMAKLGYTTNSVAIRANKIATSMVAISAPIGAATVYFSSSNGDQTGTTTTKLSGSEYGLNYSLSKRTTVYARNGKVTVGTTQINTSALGLQHAF